jgi:hypothetical protein
MTKYHDGACPETTWWEVVYRDAENFPDPVLFLTEAEAIDWADGEDAHVVARSGCPGCDWGRPAGGEEKQA